jgi:hypothetical protein
MLTGCPMLPQHGSVGALRRSISALSDLVVADPDPSMTQTPDRILPGGETTSDPGRCREDLRA